MHPAFRAFFGVAAAVFAYAAFLQLNDPDPLWWVAIYGTASGLCLLAAFNQAAPASFPGAVCILALVWAGYLWNIVYIEGYALTPMFPDQKMTGNPILDSEEGREMGGLLIVAAVLALLVLEQVYARNRPRGRTTNRDRSRY